MIVIVVAGFFVAREYRRVTFGKVNAWTDNHESDCGVVLTGSANRVREGLDLLNGGSIRKLIISGVHPAAQIHEIFPKIYFYGSLRLSDVILERRSLCPCAFTINDLYLFNTLQSS